MNTSVLSLPQETRPSSKRCSVDDGKSSFDRRHDLDALRAFAMLLGIVLHAALSFAPIPWTVQDSQQSNFYFVLFGLIHGFRMPLFFMLSGFFTAMLWRKRGLRSLLNHRFKRIFLPLVIGCFSVVPAMWIIGYVASRSSPGAAASSNLFAAVVAGDVSRVRLELENSPEDINVLDSASGSSPLCTAVFVGHTEIVKLLVDAGADVNLANRDKATPIHVASFMGRAKAAKLLLDAGVNLEVQDGTGLSPSEVLAIDFGTTSFIAGSLGVSLEETTLLVGRKEIANLLGTEEYLGARGSSRQAADLEALKGLLFYMPAFMHLWFLWFLCWLVTAFVLYTMIEKLLPLKQLPKWLVSSPTSLLWLVPLTMVPQAFMDPGTFGPDQSVGLLPIPGVLAYYAIFFFFGALYWDMQERSVRVGRWWFVSLPVALLVVFPIGFDLVTGMFGAVPRFQDEATNVRIASCLQAAFAWLMTFGLIGVCRQFLGQESPTLRYVSDSSYWLYLAHLPLVILGQWLLRDLSMPAVAKFGIITVVTSGFLLLTYEYGVRYTLIGQLLNGKRVRSGENVATT